MNNEFSQDLNEFIEPLSLDDIHKRLTSMLEDFDSFCCANSLRYYLGYGSLIGAIRHGGFIPWDDDIDLVMPRPDYERLINYDDINENLKIVSYKNSQGYYHPYAYCNIADTRTVMVEHNARKPTGKGLFIDVFPLDGLPDDYRQACNWGNHVMFWTRLLCYKNAALPKIKSFRSVLRLMGITVARFIPTSFLINRVDQMSKAYSFEESHFCTQLANKCYPIEREVQIRDDYSGISDEYTMFEGKKARIPKGFHRILTVCYGDYMTPPPVADQKGHHGFDVYLVEAYKRLHQKAS